MLLFLNPQNTLKYFHGNCNKEKSIYNIVRCIQNQCAAIALAYITKEVWGFYYTLNLTIH